MHPELEVVASCSLDRYARVHDVATRRVKGKHYLKQKQRVVLFSAEGEIREDDDDKEGGKGDGRPSGGDFEGPDNEEGGSASDGDGNDDDDDGDDAAVWDALDDGSGSGSGSGSGAGGKDESEGEDGIDLGFDLDGASSGVCWCLFA